MVSSYRARYFNLFPVSKEKVISISNIVDSITLIFTLIWFIFTIDKKPPLCRNMASLSLFYRYYIGRCSSELAQLVPLSFSRGRSTRYSDRLHDFSVTILRCYKDIYVNSFFPRTARLWNSLPIGCFPLTYDLSGFKSRMNRHLLTVGSF